MEFVKDLKGTLISLEENAESRFKFEIWFDYTKKAMNLIREGAMLAVDNFASTQNERHLSILEVVSILPIHYALGKDTSGFPGFVVEAAKNVVNDWEDQENEATEDTTKIRCIAIPTNFEVVLRAQVSQSRPPLQEEQNIPMVGATASLLDTISTEYVVNYGITQGENTFPAGTLIRDSDVRVQIRVEELLRTHFGIFGFTGSGKSNLLSTLINHLFASSRNENIKIVFFDLMGEYSALLIDHLVQMPDAMLITLGEETLPGSVARYARDKSDSNLHRAVGDLTNTTLYPRALSPYQSQFAAPLRNFLQNCKIRYWERGNPTIGELVRLVQIKGNMGNSASTVRALLDDLEREYGRNHLSTQNHNEILARIDQVQSQPKISQTASENLRNLRALIEEEWARQSTSEPLPPEFSISVPQLIQRLNDQSSSGLYIIQSHDPDKLRNFASMLGNFTYEERRRSGQIGPLVSFIFDEADEFIPQNASGSQTQSSEIAMTLARRGRKFGLGIGIATQRVIYLNSSIMAQPHTYFVSKLPRKSDRERVAEAFGVSEDMLSQTFKFKKGNWLLISHGATGLESVPLPIYSQNANDRIQQFLTNFNQQS